MQDRLVRDALLGHKSSSSNPHTLLQQHLRLRLMLAGLGQLGHHVVLGVVVGRGGVAHDAGLLVALCDVLCLLCVAGQSGGRWSSLPPFTSLRMLR